MTALALQIVEYNPTAQALEELGSKYRGVLYDVRTTAGMKEAKEARAVLKGYRTDLEKLRKSIKAPALKRCQDIDGEAKTITGLLLELEEPIDRQIKQEEERKADEERQRLREEADRRLRCLDLTSRLSRMVGENMGKPHSTILMAITVAKAVGIDAEALGEFAEQAIRDKAQTIQTLEAMAETARVKEEQERLMKAQQEEINRLREAEAERKAKALAEQLKAADEAAAKERSWAEEQNAQVMEAIAEDRPEGHGIRTEGFVGSETEFPGHPNGVLPPAPPPVMERVAMPPPAAARVNDLVLSPPLEKLRREVNLGRKTISQALWEAYNLGWNDGS